MKKIKNVQENLSILQKILLRFKILNIFKYIFYYFDNIVLFFIPCHKVVTKKKQVVILASLGLGDAINFLSVTDQYRKIYPKKDYEITLIVPKGMDLIFKNEADFDQIITIHFNDAVFNIKKRINLYRKLCNKKYDILIDPMGAVGASMNVYLSHAIPATQKITIVNLSNSICPPFLIKRSYNKVCEINDDKITNIEYYHTLANFIKPSNCPIKFHKLKDYEIRVSIPEKYFIVFPSASAEVKKWNLNSYAKVIEKVYKKTKLPVLFCGTKVDFDSIRKVIERINIPYYDITGKTDMLEFIQVIKNAKFVITNDTSVYHISVNEEVPVCIIVGGYTYNQYVTYNFKGNNYKKPYIVIDHSWDKCFNCYSNCVHLKKGMKKYPCLESITVDMAYKTIEKMINDHRNEWS